MNTNDILTANVFQLKKEALKLNRSPCLLQHNGTAEHKAFSFRGKGIQDGDISKAQSGVRYLIPTNVHSIPLCQPSPEVNSRDGLNTALSLPSVTGRDPTNCSQCFALGPHSEQPKVLSGSAPLGARPMACLSITACLWRPSAPGLREPPSS